jgi:hypothetical protein
VRRATSNPMASKTMPATRAAVAHRYRDRVIGTSVLSLRAPGPHVSISISTRSVPRMPRPSQNASRVPPATACNPPGATRGVKETAALCKDHRDRLAPRDEASERHADWHSTHGAVAARYPRLHRRPFADLGTLPRADSQIRANVGTDYAERLRHNSQCGDRLTPR